MKNEQIIMGERLRLMREGILRPTGEFATVESESGDPVRVELPEEIHTFNGWLERGFSVKRGEHSSIRFPIWRRNGSRVFKANTAFFTPSQVSPLEPRPAGKSPAAPQASPAESPPPPAPAPAGESPARRDLAAKPAAAQIEDKAPIADPVVSLPRGAAGALARILRGGGKSSEIHGKALPYEADGKRRYIVSDGYRLVRFSAPPPGLDVWSEENAQAVGGMEAVEAHARTLDEILRGYTKERDLRPLPMPPVAARLRDAKHDLLASLSREGISRGKSPLLYSFGLAPEGFSPRHVRGDALLKSGELPPVNLDFLIDARQCLSPYSDNCEAFVSENACVYYFRDDWCDAIIMPVMGDDESLPPWFFANPDDRARPYSPPPKRTYWRPQ